MYNTPPPDGQPTGDQLRAILGKPGVALSAVEKLFAKMKWLEQEVMIKAGSHMVTRGRIDVQGDLPTDFEEKMKNNFGVTVIETSPEVTGPVGNQKEGVMVIIEGEPLNVYK